jgi:hypothetical protein
VAKKKGPFAPLRSAAPSPRSECARGGAAAVPEGHSYTRARGPAAGGARRDRQGRARQREKRRRRRKRSSFGSSSPREKRTFIVVEREREGRVKVRGRRWRWPWVVGKAGSCRAESRREGGGGARTREGDGRRKLVLVVRFFTRAVWGGVS